MTTFSLQKGYTVTVFHNEPSRSQLVNTETNARTVVGETRALSGPWRAA